MQNLICTAIRNAEDEVIAIGLMVNKKNKVFSASDIAAFEVILPRDILLEGLRDGSHDGLL